MEKPKASVEEDFDLRCVCSCCVLKWGGVGLPQVLFSFRLLAGGVYFTFLLGRRCSVATPLSIRASSKGAGADDKRLHSESRRPKQGLGYKRDTTEEVVLCSMSFSSGEPHPPFPVAHSASAR